MPEVTPLKLMRKLLKKYGFVPDKLVTDDLRRTATSAVDGATTELRTRINRPDDENARCRASRARVQPKDFSQPRQPYNNFNVQRHLISARTHRAFRASAMNMWRAAIAVA
jgi:putative transposase